MLDIVKLKHRTTPSASFSFHVLIRFRGGPLCFAAWLSAGDLMELLLLPRGCPQPRPGFSPCTRRLLYFGQHTGEERQQLLHRVEACHLA